MQMADLEALLKGKFMQHENDDGEYVPGEVMGIVQDETRHRIVSKDASGAIRVESLDMSGRFWVTAEACQRAIDGEPDDGAAELPDAA